jgi:hypothetical protein
MIERKFPKMRKAPRDNQDEVRQAKLARSCR